MNGDFHARTAVGAGDGGLLPVAAAHLGQILEPHLDVAHLADHDAADLVKVGEPRQHAHDVLGGAVGDAAAGDVHVLALQPAGDLRQENPQQRRAALVDVDLNFLFHAAGDDGRGHAVDAFQALLDRLVGQQPQPRLIGERHVAGRCAAHADAHDRVECGVEAQQDRILGAARQPQLGELLAYVDGGEVHVGAPGELHDHVGEAGAGHAGQVHQARDDAHRILDRGGDEGLDIGGRDTRILGADGQGRERQVGQQVDRQLAERDQPEDHQGDEEHHHRHRAAGRQGNDFHGRRFPQPARERCITLQDTARPGRPP